MFEFLALITNKHYWKLHSYIIKFIFIIYGIKVGKNFYCEGVPKLKIRGKAKNIVIGDNVNFLGNIDLRNRENGKIVICDSVSIDSDTRFVSANDTILTIGEGTGIGPFCVFNCGVSVSIGKNCLISGHIYIQSSEHGFDKGKLIKEQNHSYGEIIIGDDCWLAAEVMIAKNVKLGSGCVVGAKSFLRNIEYEDNSIITGTPSKKIGERK
ncbi:acyltransferase [Sulfurimonas sp.]|uniref:acyltransferase n=1 Tax=Sulfurimonas sp. TaxID=2022749 RepID=UPI0026120C48|nr:acyltransferase [Sulfurimonas sp.]MCW8895336.1 acyltransferase [Sulfurimonas sp.]